MTPPRPHDRRVGGHKTKNEKDSVRPSTPGLEVSVSGRYRFSSKQQWRHDQGHRMNSQSPDAHIASGGTCRPGQMLDRHDPRGLRSRVLGRWKAMSTPQSN